MNRSATLPTLIIGLTILGAAALLAPAGSLQPPAGPIAETFKTLEQVEPGTPLTAETTPGGLGYAFIIDQPGSYYLTEDLATSSGVDGGIGVAASNVTIDLNGFTISGMIAGGISTNGFGPLSISNCTVKNGSLVDCGAGIFLGLVPHSRIEDVQVIDCGISGIALASGIISGCVVTGASFGLELITPDTVVLDSAVYDNQVNVSLLNPPGAVHDSYIP